MQSDWRHVGCVVIAATLLLPGLAAAGPQAPTVDFNEVAAAVGMPQSQKAGWDAAIEAKKADLDRFDAFHKVNYAKAKAIAHKDSKAPKPQKEQAGRYIKQVEQGRVDLSIQHDQKIFDVLSSDQKAAWAGHKINQAAINEFACVGLLPAQERQIRAISDSVGRRTPMLYIAENKPVLDAVKREVFATVLLKEQQELYIRLKAPPPGKTDPKKGKK